MKQYSLVLIVLLVICGCTPRSAVKDPFLTTAEVTHKVDSLARIFYVDAKLNHDYLEKHPLRVSQLERLKQKVISISPAFNNENDSSSIGEFRSLPLITKKDTARMQELKDSVHENSVYDRCSFGDTICLSERYYLSYEAGFSRLDTDHMWGHPIYAYIVDNLTNDSVKADVSDLKYAKLSNAPLVFAFAFTFKYDGHTYIFHRIYDVRIDLNLNIKVFDNRPRVCHKTTACYKVN